MPSYSVDLLDGPERGIRVACEEHGAREEFPPGRRKVAFHCDDCGYELEVALHDLLEWRDMGEMC